ncbi:MAG TPA: hypothetical protein VIN03_02515 [Roseateles sp.]
MAASHTQGTVLAFEVQCNSFGTASHGGMFALNAGAGAIDPRYLSGQHARILQFCSPELVAAATRLAAEILQGHPEMEKPAWHWEQGRDNWCQYFDVESVRRWGELLLPFLPQLLERTVIQSGLPLHEFALGQPAAAPPAVR